MKVINIILASIIIYLGVGSTCFSQENDKALLERVDKVYRLIPIDLNTDELLQKINEVEKYVGLVIDSIESKEAKEKARLIQAKGLLWSLKIIAGVEDYQGKMSYQKELRGWIWILQVWNCLMISTWLIC